MLQGRYALAVTEVQNQLMVSEGDAKGVDPGQPQGLSSEGSRRTRVQKGEGDGGADVAVMRSEDGGRARSTGMQLWKVRKALSWNQREPALETLWF